MVNETINLLIQVLNASNLNSCILLKDHSNIENTDGRFRFHLYEDYCYEDVLPFVSHHLQPERLLRICDDFHMYTYVLWLPDHCIGDFHSNIMTIGPFLDGRPDDPSLAELMERMKLPEELSRDVKIHYWSLPLIPDPGNFDHYLTSILKNLFELQYQVLCYPAESEIHIEQSPSYHRLRSQPRFAMQRVEERYRLENQMLQAITAGDYEAAKSYWVSFLLHQIPPRSDNPLQDSRNLKIVLNSLLRKAAEQGHVHPIYVDDLSTTFAILISEAKSLRELDTLSEDMIRKYCLLVQNHSMRSFSPTIQTVVSYIDFHCEEDLSLMFFADMCHLSKAYLSNLFKKETGSTVTDYIHTVRMRKALTLLNGTSFSIQTIASICGYHDLNYFIRVFKKRYDMSPKQYQKMIGQGGRSSRAT